MQQYLDLMRVVREILGYSPTLHAQTRKEEAPPRSPRGAPPLGVSRPPLPPAGLSPFRGLDS